MKETEQNYDLLAEDYARTRAFIPDDIKQMADYVSPGERVLDMGCANGRLFTVLREKKADYFGIDISEKLIEIAERDYPQANFQVADALALPFPDNYFDKVLSVSVLHNIPSREFRFKYLQEAQRVLKSKGLLVLRVWHFWKRKEGWQIFFKHFFLKLAGKSKLGLYDVFVPWKNSQGQIIAQRYFHCFSKNGLVCLVKKAGFKVKKAWLGGKDPRTNIYIIAEK